MKVVGTTIYYGRGKHESLFAEGASEMEAHAELNSKIERMINRMANAFLCMVMPLYASIVMWAMVVVPALFGPALAPRILSTVAIAIGAWYMLGLSTFRQRAYAWDAQLKKRQGRSVHLQPVWSLDREY